MLVNGTKLGTLEFCGTVEFAGGTWAGVELDEPEGKNDGTVNGVTYFHCKPSFGVMIQTNKIEKVERLHVLNFVSSGFSFAPNFPNYC